MSACLLSTPSRRAIPTPPPAGALAFARPPPYPQPVQYYRRIKLKHRLLAFMEDANRGSEVKYDILRSCAAASDANEIGILYIRER